MKKSLCMILTAVIGISMLPMTVTAMEGTPYFAESVANTDPEEWLVIETREGTEQLQIIEKEVQYHPFSLNLGAEEKLNLFIDEYEGEYFLCEHVVNKDVLEYSQQAESTAEKYINRVKLPVFAKDFYVALEEAVDGDGNNDFLMNDPFKSEDEIKIIHTKDEYGNDVTYITYAIVTDIELKVDCEQQVVVNELYEAASTAYTAFDRDHPEVFWLKNEVGFMVSEYSTYLEDSNGNIKPDSMKNYVNLYFFLADNKGGQINQIRSDEFLGGAGEYFIIGEEIFYDMDDVAEYPYQLAQQIIDSFDASEDDNAYDGTAPDFIDKYNLSADVTFKDLTDAGKVAYFDFWLTRNADYNTDVAECGNTALNSPYECISALWAKKGEKGPVCEGYARALKLLCEMENIGCVLVTGDSGPNFDGKEDHMWNYVEVDGKWYAQDTTWNDPTNADPWTSYLLVGSNTILKDHHSMNHGFNNVSFPEGPIIQAVDFSREGTWMVQDAVEASVEEGAVKLSIYPTHFDVIEKVEDDEIVMLIATLYDQTENRLLDVKTKVCKFSELDAWTAELSAGENTDLRYKVFLINTENHGPIMKQIEDNL